MHYPHTIVYNFVRVLSFGPVPEEPQMCYQLCEKSQGLCCKCPSTTMTSSHQVQMGIFCPGYLHYERRMIILVALHRLESTQQSQFRSLTGNQPQHLLTNAYNVNRTIEFVDQIKHNSYNFTFISNKRTQPTFMAV